MLAGTHVRVRTDSAVHFLGACAAGAALVENLAKATYVPEGLAAGNHCRSRVRAVRMICTEAISWTVQFFRKATGIGGAVIDAETFLGQIALELPNKATGDTLYVAVANNLDIPYVDDDAAGKIHVRIINTTAATAKSANAAGAVVLEMDFEPTQGR